MKKTFEFPEIEIIRFDTEAVLNTNPSGMPKYPEEGDGLGWQ